MALSEATPSRAARAPATGWLGRAGLVARGAVYAVIGILALKLAFGDGGKTTSQQGALGTIASQPFGKVLLVLLAVGRAAGSRAACSRKAWRATRSGASRGPSRATGPRTRTLASPRTPRSSVGSP